MATTTRRRGTGSDSPPGATAEDRRYLDRFRSKLSRTTQRARWTHEPGEEPDRNGQTLATRNHDVIRDRAERRGARPTVLEDLAAGEPRTLRFAFRDGGEADRTGRSRRLEPIEWEDFFRVFDDRKLVFLYQERRRDGRDSNFFRLDNPTREDG